MRLGVVFAAIFIFTAPLTASCPAHAQLSLVPEAEEGDGRIFTPAAELLRLCTDGTEASTRACNMFIESFIYSLALPDALGVTERTLICLPSNTPVPRDYVVSLLTTYLDNQPTQRETPAVAALWNLFVDVGWAGASCQ